MKNAEKYGVIYRYMFENGKCYIGQTIDLRKRINYYRNHYKKNKYPFLRALKKYGFDESKFEIICFANSLNELNNLEIEEIKIHNSTDKNKGYNLSTGGGGLSGLKHSEKYKKMMSENHKGEKNPFYNKKHKKETIKKISESCKKLKPVWLGKNHDEKYKISMSKNHPKSKKILCCETNIIYHSIRDCARKMKLNSASISKVLSGEYSHHHNYTFKLINVNPSI